MFRPVALLLFKLCGWKVIDHRPATMGQCIYVVAPHTSNWDFLVGVCARSIGRLKNTKYLAKKQLFVWPFGWLFRALGGYPVDRGKNTNMRVAMTVGFVGLIIGLLGTFPPIYDLVVPK